MKTTPFAHQTTGLDLSKDRFGYAYFMEMGTGKSRLLLENVEYLHRAGKIKGLVVVAKKGVYRNWIEEELPAHYSDPYEAAHWGSQNTAKQNQKMHDLLRSTSPQLKVLCINIEALRTAPAQHMLQRFLTRFPSMFAVDESSSIKNRKSMQTKACLKLSTLAEYRRILTGTPITKDPLDLWSQAKFLSAGYFSKYPDFIAFRATYARMVNFRLHNGREFPKIVDFINLEELKEEISTWSYRVLKKDCLDLPEKVYERREVAMTPEQGKAYRDLKSVGAALMADGTITAQAAITLIGKLNRITCGHIKMDDGRLVRLPSNRVKELLDILEDVDENSPSGKVLVWCKYTDDVDVVSDALREAYGANTFAKFYGATPDEERIKIIKAFQDPASPLRFLVATMKTGGTGLTLTAAATAIRYSYDYDLEAWLQSEDRNHRHGQKADKVTYIDLVSPDTINEIILKNLRSKHLLAERVLAYAKEIFI